MTTISILSGGAAQGLVRGLADIFKTQTGAAIDGEFGAVGIMADKLRASTPADLVILTHALGTGLAGFAVLEQDPACINVLDVDEAGRWLVRLVNHTPYNPVKIGLEQTTMERLYEEYQRRAR